MQVKREIRKVAVPITSGLKKCWNNFAHVVKMWATIILTMQAANPDTAHELIPCELSEDETGLVSILHYCSEGDTVVGACGWRSPDHRCDPDFAPIVGNDWDNLVRIVQKCVPSTYARVIMVNPLIG